MDSDPSIGHLKNADPGSGPLARWRDGLVRDAVSDLMGRTMPRTSEVTA